MGFHTTDLPRAKLQRKILHTTALVKIDHKITKMWRSKIQCPTTSFANEEMEFHEGRKIPEDSHPVSHQNLELPNPREVHFILLDTQVNMTFKCHKHRCPCAQELLNTWPTLGSLKHIYTKLLRIGW